MSLLLLAAAVLGGIGLTLQDDDDRPTHVRLAAGAVLGVTLSSLVGYALASWLGLGPLSVGLASALTLALAGIAPRERWLLLLPTRRPSAGGLAFGLTGSTILVLVFQRAFFATPEGIFTGIENNLGDLPFHLSLIAGFSEGRNFPPQHPELSGTRLTYPFLADFGVAQLVSSGLELERAMLLQNMLLALAMLALLHQLARSWTGDAWAARLAPLLLFLNGGLGFLLLWPEARAAGQPLLATMLRLPHDYTIVRTGELRFGNTLVCLLTTQRSLLLGAPLLLIALELLWRAATTKLNPERRRRLLLAAGLVAGLLPMAHVHALLSLLAVAACLAFLFPPRRPWLLFFGSGLAIALPQLLWLARGSSLQGAAFLAWQPGWDSGGRNPLLFWLWNSGPFLPLLALACLRVVPPPLRRFHLPFWGLFVVPNLLRLSPWIWDNIKFLFFWLLASAPLVALVLARLLRRGGFARAAGATLTVLLTLSGSLDVWRVVSRQVALRVFDAAGIAFAAELVRLTPARALVLRAATHDSPVQLSGRRALLGYPGHIWSQGLQAGDREREIGRIYEGAQDAQALLARHGVDFIVVGPQERTLYKPDEDFLARFPLVGRSGPYELRRVR